MVREFIKSPDNCDKMVLTCNGTDERDQMAAVFHFNKPDGYVYCIGWDPTGMRLSFQLVPGVKTDAAGAITPDKMGEERRAKLMGMGLKDLRTMAAEQGVEHDPKCNKVSLVALMLKKELQSGVLAEKAQE